MNNERQKRAAAVKATEKNAALLKSKKYQVQKNTTQTSAAVTAFGLPSGFTKPQSLATQNPEVTAETEIDQTKFFENIPKDSFTSSNIEKAFSCLYSPELDISNLSFDANVEQSHLDTAFNLSEGLDNTNLVMPDENAKTVEISSTQMEELAQKVASLMKDTMKPENSASVSTSSQSITTSKSDSAISGSVSMNEEILDNDETSFRLQVGSERAMLKQHPYLFYLFKIGLTKVEKNLASYDDWTLNRLITIWQVEKPENAQAKILNYASTKISKQWFSLKTGNTTPSLFVRTINSIDRSFYNGLRISQGEVGALIQELKEESEPVWQKNAHPKSSAPSSQPGRSSFQTCHRFNSAEGCKLDNCRFPHSCSFHARKGIRASHSVVDCEAKNSQQ